MPKISELPETTSIEDSALIPVVHNGQTCKAQISDVLSAPRTARLHDARWIYKNTETGILNAQSIPIDNTQLPLSLRAAVAAVANPENTIFWNVIFNANNAPLQTIDDVYHTALMFDGTSSQPTQGPELTLGPGRWKIIAEGGAFNQSGNNIDLMWDGHGYLHNFWGLDQAAYLNVGVGHTEKIIAYQNQGWFFARLAVYQVSKYEESPFQATIEPFGNMLSITAATAPAATDGIITATANLYDLYGSLLTSSNSIFAAYTP